MSTDDSVSSPCVKAYEWALYFISGHWNTEFSSPLLAKKSSTDGSNNFHSLPLQTDSQRLGKFYLIASTPFHIRDVRHGSSVIVHNVIDNKVFKALSLIALYMD